MESDSNASAIFEIREFIDDDGNMTRSELSDLSNEAKLNGDEMKELVSQIPAVDKSAKNQEMQEKILEQLKRIGVSNTSPATLDEHATLVRELAEIAHASKEMTDEYSNASNSLERTETEILDDLLRQEEEYSEATLMQSKKLISGDGWKKGFFGDKQKKSTSQQKVDKKSASHGRTVQFAADGIGIGITKNDSDKAAATTTTTGSGNTALHETTKTKQSQLQTPATTRPTAFTGAILEKFP